MNSKKTTKWEHSRYKDWRPNYVEEEESTRKRRRRGRDDREYRPRRRSFLGWLFRIALSLALILALFGPGGDYVNGRAKSAEGACAVRVVVDGDTILSGCPDGRELPSRVAGYVAPELLAPGCFGEFRAALMAALEIRKALYSADDIVLASTAPTPVAAPAPAPAPVAETETATETPPDAPGAEEAGETGADAAAPEEPAAASTVEPTLRVLVDGTDLAQVMLASGVAQPVGGSGWCE